ncbi:MAG: hypothetical protein HND52_17900 [Ignavibacteriae bacterium]|jgi:uncharacterized OB-fold protein|nr:hypothetical protein [Ignavibacteriota bacterium]NOG99838.1 hypothetical protein [Ignavibacteriota bacterium]
MICPNCEAEYVKGITKCADCGETLIPREEFEGHLLKPSDWITVYTTGKIYEAEMLKSNLEGGGIETLIVKQKDSSFPAVGDLAVVKVNVKKTDAENAVTVIKDILDSEEESEEN